METHPYCDSLTLVSAAGGSGEGAEDAAVAVGLSASAAEFIDAALGRWQQRLRTTAAEFRDRQKQAVAVAADR